VTTGPCYVTAVSAGRQRVGDRLRGFNQVRDQAVIDFEQTFVLAEVACVVALVQHSPDRRAETQGVRKHLETMYR
jgi:hypothetical protein